MRGTDDLQPDQRPRRKLRGRTQPHRTRHPLRAPGPTLTAMLNGKPLSLPNPADWQRERQRKRKRP